MAKERIESKVSSKGNPRLLARPFHCEGADSIGAFPTEPQETEAGLSLKYITFDNSHKRKVVEDMSEGFNGCAHLSGTKCTIAGDKECPVAAVSIADFHKRVEELKKLKYIG